MIGLIRILWKRSWQSDIDEKEFAAMKEMDTMEFYTYLSKLPVNDRRRLLALNPTRVKHLLDMGTVNVSRVFHVAEDLVMLKR